MDLVVPDAVCDVFTPAMKEEVSGLRGTHSG